MLARLGLDAGDQHQVPNEPLRPGPQGSRIEVIDYDGVKQVPVSEDRPGRSPRLLMRGGLDPAEAIRGFTSRWSTRSP
mgnify:CR=1 FL=1